MDFQLLTEQRLGFLCWKEGCTGSSKSTLVKIPHSWKSCVVAQMYLLEDDLFLLIENVCKVAVGTGFKSTNSCSSCRLTQTCVCMTCKYIFMRRLYELGLKDNEDIIHCWRFSFQCLEAWYKHMNLERIQRYGIASFCRRHVIDGALLVCSKFPSTFVWRKNLVSPSRYLPRIKFSLICCHIPHVGMVSYQWELDFVCVYFTYG